MIAFASCVADEAKYARYALPGLRLAAEPDSLVMQATDAESIFSAYNEVLDAVRARDDLEALVLMHEDAEITDPGFCDVLRRAFAEPDVAVVGAIGAAGVTSIAWWGGDCRGRVRETRGLLDFGGGGHDVDAVDGLLIALSPWAVRELRFDEETFGGFHAYDVDICFQARAAGRRVRVEELGVLHHTKGGYGDKQAWDEADRLWREKWLKVLAA